MAFTYTPGCQGDRNQARRRLSTKPFGYQLHLGADELDVYEFKSLCQRAAVAGTAEKHAEAVDLYGAAIAVYQGRALGDVRQGPVLTAHARQLDEKLLSASEARIHHLLQMGSFPEAISDLSALTVLHPLHEGLHVQMIRALCRSGRRSESLKTYQEIRRRLIDDVGIEPSAALQGAQREALCCESHAS